MARSTIRSMPTRLGGDSDRCCRTRSGTATSALVLRLAQRTSTVLALSLALVVAYAIYELVLFAATPVLGGEGAFTAAIIGRIGVLNILWLIGLVAASETVRLLNPYRRHQTAS